MSAGWQHFLNTYKGSLLLGGSIFVLQMRGRDGIQFSFIHQHSRYQYLGAATIIRKSWMVMLPRWNIRHFLKLPQIVRCWMIVSGWYWCFVCQFKWYPLDHTGFEVSFSWGDLWLVRGSIEEGSKSSGFTRLKQGRCLMKGSQQLALLWWKRQDTLIYIYMHTYIWINIISDREGNRAGLGENGTLKCIYGTRILMRLWAVWEKASRTAPAVLMPRSEAHLKEYWPVWWLPPFHPIIWENFVGGLWNINPVTMLQTCLYSSDLITPSSSPMGTSKCIRWYDPRIFRVMLPAIPCPRSIVALYELADIRTVDEGLMRLGG